MRLRRVDPALLLPGARPSRAPSPRELRRRRIEAALERVVRGAAADPSVAYRVTLLDGERPSSVRAALGRVKGRIGADGVRVVVVGGRLYVTAAAPSRGRRSAG